jgi:hypothetical protein
MHPRRLLATALIPLLFLSCKPKEIVVQHLPHDADSIATTDAAKASVASSPMAGLALPIQILPKLSFNDLPAGWQEIEGKQGRVATLSVSNTDESGEISITVFPGDVGGMAANVNRWRAQLGLSTLSSEAAVESLKHIDGMSGVWKLLQIHNGTNAMLAGACERTGQTWFVKFTGSPSLTEAHFHHFVEFLAKIQLP